MALTGHKPPRHTTLLDAVAKARFFTLHSIQPPDLQPGIKSREKPLFFLHIRDTFEHKFLTVVLIYI
jgi:hypothetical protein